MNVASKEFCSELYELSKWKDTEFHWCVDDLGDGLVIREEAIGVSTDFPAYDLGYLLRKLPLSVDEEHGFVLNHHSACYLNPEKAGDVLYHQIADTAEDALCRLAIELIKQKVITP